MTIYDDYIAYHDKYVAEYGEKTIVFLQVGDFFELYGVNNEHENVGPDMYGIGDMCGLVITRKNKSVVENSRSNPLMAGFPLHSFQKQVQNLVNLHYTIIIIRQVTPPPNVKREVTEIISPSTFIQSSSIAYANTNYLVAYVWSAMDQNKYVGMAGVDLSTGHTWVYEVNHKTDALDEAYRLLQVYAPKEIMVRGSASIVNQKQIMEILQHPCAHVDWTIQPSTSIALQNAILEKAYGTQSKGLLTPIEQFGLEKYDLGRLAITCVLQFAYEHNDNIIKKLQKPEILLNERYLTLEYNSALQLNLISHHPQEKPLLDILNRTSTALGSRMFRERIMMPLTDINQIENRYQKVDEMIASNLADAHAVQLRKVMDLERALRRMVLGTFTPMEWVPFANSFDVAKSLLLNDNIKEITTFYQTRLNLDECSKYSLADVRSNIFLEGQYADVDACAEIIKGAFAILERCTEEIGTDLCRLDSNERDGYSVCITKKRWETFKSSSGKNSLLQVKIADYVAKPISSTSSVCRLYHPKLEAAAQTIMDQQRKIQSLVIVHYKEFLRVFIDLHQENVLNVANALAELDVICTSARNAIDFDYCRPVLVTTDDHSSFDTSGIRHPIIERLPSQVAYVQNDISLRANGMLLYGINSSGKSSFMKAIGLNIIMAQAGMYVSATNFNYHPYRHIFTRIASTDNLYRGMSSFVVEMTELRMILERADEFSLVLGDELCAGTESISALSIVTAGVHHLAKKNATFLFATHLHELTDYIGDIPNIRVAHMHIEIQNGKIIYDRKLLEGKGNPMYGLEVCYALGLPDGFLKHAQSVRRKIMDVPMSLANAVTSRYNTKVIVDQCKLCGIRKATETHHIKQQAFSDKNGFVQKGVHMNAISNLIPLCEECHLKQHHGDDEITKYLQTSDGVEVVISPKEKVNSKKILTNSDLRDKWCYMPQIGWKKKTIRGVWRLTSWELVAKELDKYCVNVEDELEARSLLLAKI